MRGRRSTFAATLLVFLSACSQTSVGDVPEVSWSRASSPGFMDDVVGVVYMSPDIFDSGGEDGGAVMFIDDSGKTKVLKTGSLDNGMITTNKRREVSFSSETTSYLLAGDSSSVRKRGGRHATGHWAGTRPDGSFVSVFNSGGGEISYETDIFWTAQGKPQHSVMRDIPGSMGIAGDVLYSMNEAVSVPDGSTVLYATDLSGPGETRKLFGWKFEGSADGRELAGYSGVFGSRGMLWFLEDTRAVDKDEEVVPSADGTRSTLRLAKLDPQKRTYESTEIASFPNDSVIDDETGWVSIAQAAVNGHLYRNRIHVIDYQGRILAVDLGTKKLSTVGRVSQDAMSAIEPIVTWNGNTMTALIFGEFREDPQLETYNLDTGKLVKTIDVKGLAGFLKKNQDIGPWTIAAFD